jgi:hypothetical protein
MIDSSPACDLIGFRVASTGRLATVWRRRAQASSSYLCARVSGDDSGEFPEFRLATSRRPAEKKSALTSARIAQSRPYANPAATTTAAAY